MICMFQVYFEFIQNLVTNLVTSSILWTCLWNGFVFLFCFRSVLEVGFHILRIYSQTQRSICEVYFCNWCICSNSEVYRKYISQIDVFLFKLRSMPELDFLNLCIYFETLKYSWSRLSILMCLFWNS